MILNLKFQFNFILLLINIAQKLEIHCFNALKPKNKALASVKQKPIDGLKLVKKALIDEGFIT